MKDSRTVITKSTREKDRLQADVVASFILQFDKADKKFNTLQF